MGAYSLRRKNWKIKPHTMYVSSGVGLWGVPPIMLKLTLCRGERLTLKLTQGRLFTSSRNTALLCNMKPANCFFGAVSCRKHRHHFFFISRSLTLLCLYLKLLGSTTIFAKKKKKDGVIKKKSKQPLQEQSQWLFGRGKCAKKIFFLPHCIEESFSQYCHQHSNVNISEYIWMYSTN